MFGLFNYIRSSVQRKLLVVNMLLVTVVAVTLYLFLMANFQRMTDFSLQQNKEGTETTVDDYLTKYVQEKAFATWLQIDRAQSRLAILGRTAQTILDHYEEIQANPALLDFSVFQTELTEERGALTSPATALTDALIPPPIADDPQARQLLEISGLLNLSMDAIFDTSANTAFIYFVGNPETPITRAYPNIHLVEALGDGLDLLFWQDYFAANPTGWAQWYRDPALRTRVPNPVTIEPPYQDAAGQGSILTMFYPLWDQKNDTFAGAVGADITLNSMINNLLSITVAESGFAFLLNGNGEVIAMPAAGHELFDVDLTAIETDGLAYYSGSLISSENPAVQALDQEIRSSDKGVYRFDPSNGADPNAAIHRVTFTHLPAFSNSQYEQDRWTVAIAVPEAEIFQVLNQTDIAIQNERRRLGTLSIAILLGFLLLATVASVQISHNVTRDIRTLAQAAEQVSAKNYAIDLKLKSHDEIGQLGQTFGAMAQEIRQYTTHLEERIAERTADLQRANDQITQLNEKLQDENLRMSAELDIARQLQMMVLPAESEIDAIAELDIAGYMQPADEVGGDYYDIVGVGDSVYLGIGDVTGHGLPAGVIMLMAQTAMLTLSQTGEQDMERLLSVINQVLYRNIIRIQENKTMTLAVLHYQQHKYSLVGQHESVLICRRDGTIEEIDTLDLGFPVGLEYDINDFISTKQFELAAGDVMLLYTDGVTEAERGDGEQFGIERLKQALWRYHDLPAKAIVGQTIHDVHQFIDGQTIYDDISALVIKQR
ncbi:MAG TPA: SpoIIE family protein phosphatase [Caldilineaceae bacterium]|nr:SpoIIE family protein phosphatase [Caldilineaceae bacterium]